MLVRSKEVWIKVRGANRYWVKKGWIGVVKVQIRWLSEKKKKIWMIIRSQKILESYKMKEK